MRKRSSMDGENNLRWTVLMRSWVLVWRSGPWRFSCVRLVGGSGCTPIPDLPWTSHPKPYLPCLQLHLCSDFPLLSHIAKLCSTCSGFVFVFIFWRECGVVWFYGFFFFFLCLFSKKNSGFMGLLEIALVIVFMGLFLGFIFCFSGFDGDWAWLLDLDLGFARDWFSCFLDLGRTWRKFHVSI